MISKPPSNWADEGHAVTAVQSAVTVAKYTAGATKRGFRLFQGLALGLFAAPLGFGGLAQFTIGGLGDSTAAGGGILMMLTAATVGYFAWRNLKKAFASNAGPQPRQFAQEPAQYTASQYSAPQFSDPQYSAPPFGAPRVGERREVENSKTQLGTSLLFNVIWILVGLYLLQTSGAVAKLIGLAVIIWGAILALKAVRGLMGDSPAFSYDGDGITVPGWFGEKHLAWRDVSDFSVRTLNTYAYGVVKVASKHMLYALKTSGGKMLLPTQFTGFDLDALYELAAQLELYRNGVAGARQRFSQDYSPAAPTPSPGFGQAGVGQAGFGRNDTAPPPTSAAAPFASRPVAPSAPSFGRRQGVFDNHTS